ncbi:trehalose-phosphatase [Polymorphobacter fuscus]|uniref:Trehalose 6-phosphate phosphatase n=1 Tax=Sandarakinorhabdus fusca TaxID=1439888 RepID=A0A7C9GSN3_9SPHN|nr:trehalose-phosphatase [Polymorphobacter fuscus]KAB7645650.1 trehalose-phosphatase [Polymorphobacter fuscus]MQT18011.1 trehalose-phosphatase [Polymorphobacter fuscus]
MLERPKAVVAGQDALFLDFDGTLAPLFPRPDDTILGVTIRRLIIRLQQALEGRLAIVSGRSIATIDRIVAIPGLAIAGVHGLERRSAKGLVTRTMAGAGLAEARRELLALVTGLPRLLLEDKGASLALHYRTAPDLEAAARDAAQQAAARHGLELQSGKMVIEIREPGPDKGGAVDAFMAEPPFHGARPIFVGDDVTDEAGFAAAARLGGHGVLVAQPRPTAATFRLDDVTAVEMWLAESVKAMEFS